MRPGDRLGHWELVELLGRGGMGEVFRARDSDGRERAVKVLSDALAHDTDLVARFDAEVDVLTRLEGRHVVTVYGHGSQAGRRFVVMQLVRGPDLDSYLRRTGVPLPAPRAVEILRQVCDALTDVHAVGIVHRDVKPSNVLLDRHPPTCPEELAGWTDHCLLTDFGIVLGGPRNGVVTQVGHVVGTPHYMAPERFEGRADRRVDVYAAGALLFELLLGHPPFRYGGDVGEVRREVLAGRHRDDPRPAPTDDGTLGDALARVVARAMAVDPDQRYQDAASLARAAQEAVTGPSAGPGAATTIPPGPVVVPHGSEPGRDGGPAAAEEVRDPGGAEAPRDGPRAERTPAAPAGPSGPGGPGAGSGSTGTGGGTGVGDPARWWTWQRRCGAVVALMLVAVVAVVACDPVLRARFAPPVPAVTLTVPVPGSGPVAVAADGRTAYVPDRRGGTLQILDTGTGAARVSAAVGPAPRDVVVAPDGRTAYVTGDSSLITAVDTATGRVLRTVGAPPLPRGMAVDSGGGRLYVASAGPGPAAVVDLAFGSSRVVQGVGGGTVDAALDPSGDRVYLLGPGAGGAGVLYVVDTATDTVTGSVRGLPAGTSSVAVAGDGTVYVAAQGSGFGGTGALVAVDPGAGTVEPVPLGASDDPGAVAADGAGVVAASSDGSLLVVRDAVVVARTAPRGPAGSVGVAAGGGRILLVHGATATFLDG